MSHNKVKMCFIEILVKFENSQTLNSVVTKAPLAAGTALSLLG